MESRLAETDGVESACELAVLGVYEGNGRRLVSSILRCWQVSRNLGFQQFRCRYVAVGHG